MRSIDRGSPAQSLTFAERELDRPASHGNGAFPPVHETWHSVIQVGAKMACHPHSGILRACQVHQVAQDVLVHIDPEHAGVA